MKKIVVVIISTLFLTACSEEKDKLEQAILEQMQNDQDIQDYKLSPEKMTDCVLDKVSAKMPGVFVFDPRRQPYYSGYRKLLTVKQSADPQQSLLEAQESFGSKKAAMQAMMNYSGSVMDCVSALVTQSGEES